MKDSQSKVLVSAIEINATSNLEKASKPVNTEDVLVLATRDLVLFPGVVFPVTLGREMSKKVARVAEEGGELVAVVSQIDPDIESPRIPDEVVGLGVLARVLSVFELPDGSANALIKAADRIQILDHGVGLAHPGLPTASIVMKRDFKARNTDKEFLALTETIRQTALNIIAKTSEGTPSDFARNIKTLEDPTALVNTIATYTPAPLEEKVKMLQQTRIKDRAFSLLANLTRSEQMAEIMEGIKMRTRQRLGESQRHAFLQTQMETLREELYGSDEDDADALRNKAGAANLPDRVAASVEKEIAKLSRLNPSSPDYSVQYSYIETLLDLPWSVTTEPTLDFADAEEILNSEHYGLEKVKERILEQLAVMMHNPTGRSPILCLVGAPGVGKTSLGKVIAAALGRNYTRVSLGGMHDEAEIRGHRRTYIGAMPGRIIDAIRRGKSSNALMLLDEIDKLGKDFRGDPSAALLEVLDPEQNHSFHDNYVDLDFDLSKVMFVATANTLSTVPQPLIDRMEVIEIPGYLPEEKREIALRHLVGRSLAAMGVEADSITFTPEAIDKIIESYTSESGVRQLEKEINSAVRKLILKHMRSNGDESPVTVTPEMIKDLLGVERYTRERYEASDIPGVATGLAWTAVGGEILFIETSVAPGKGDKLVLTGNLGDVMKESAQIALQYVRAHADAFGIDAKVFEDKTLHIHVPEGAIPKDGPSAGITMATSIISAITGRPVRRGFAMTGEMTLRGKVLPVGGIKEKVLAARRAGLTDIVMSKENRKDVADIKPEHVAGLTFHYVGRLDEVVRLAIGY